MHRYQVFNLYFNSELAFRSGVIQETTECDTHPVEIKFGSISPIGLSHIEQQGACYQINPTQFWLNIPLVARFLVEKGQSITIDPHPTITHDELETFIFGPCLNALCMQKNIFLLRGNTIHIANHTILLLGSSGSGKSTLSAACLKRGYPVITDHFTAFTNEFCIMPGFPWIKLWANTLSALALNTPSIKVRAAIEKYYLPIKPSLSLKNAPKYIYQLATSRKNTLKLTEQKGSQKFLCIEHSIYGHEYLITPKTHGFYFQKCVELAHKIPMIHVESSLNLSQIDATIDAIISDIQSREVANHGKS